VILTDGDITVIRLLQNNMVHIILFGSQNFYLYTIVTRIDRSVPLYPGIIYNLV
jgi:hypothetical protein